MVGCEAQLAYLAQEKLPYAHLLFGSGLRLEFGEVINQTRSNGLTTGP